MTEAQILTEERVRVPLTYNQVDLLGLFDSRVRDQYRERGVEVDVKFVASGTPEALHRTLRYSAECFEEAESAGTRRSMKALIGKIDRFAPFAEDS